MIFLNPFTRGGGDRFALVVGMTGVQMGDRIVQIGCAHAGRLGAIAAKVGLSGRAAAFVPDQDSAGRAQKGAREAGALVEIETAPPTSLPAGADEFDLALVDDTGGLLGAMRPEERVLAVREMLRILRPGGRVMVIGAAPRGGLGALVSRAQSGPPFDPAPSLEADGFRAVRKLAEREGLIFVEGIKPRSG
jgi:SAM-dependent methyltransferase